MKLPLSWLTSHVATDLKVDELADVMSQHGLEVEGITRPSEGIDGVRTARVLAHHPHPDADKLRVVHVTGEDGDGEIEVVCGASNFDAGDVVVHAPPGSHIPGMQLDARSLRGVVSNGMLCSPRELGLGDDHAGILVLDEHTPVGIDLAALIPVGEPVIEIAVQADRGDHLGILGVARDLAAILDTTFTGLEVPAPVGAGKVDVTLSTDRCARFVTWELQDVAIGPAPLWMRQRLLQCGVRPIDAVVDVTNYVMLETGQPLHAFDLGTIRGGRLNVREASGGERLVTLDGIERTLVTGDLVIEDSERLASLAGVMGGLDTEVTAATTSVLIEAAVWDPAAIRATSRRLGLVSEASVRFERRVDPEGAERAAGRAAALLMDVAGARATGSGVVEAPENPAWASRSSVELDTGQVRRLLGVEALDAGRQQILLQRSGCAIEIRGERLNVVAPSWRGDLGRPADLAEEIARLHGYDQIPAVVPSVPLAGGRSAAQQLARDVRSIMLAYGFDEAVSRPFVGDEACQGVLPSAGRVVLSNPLAKDAAAMRPSLVEGLLKAVRHNVGQGRAGVALGEIGRIFRPVDDPVTEVLDTLAQSSRGGDWRWTGPDGQGLPTQPRALALVAQGLASGPDWLDPTTTYDVYDILATFDRVAEALSPPDRPITLVRDPVERDGFHPGRSARLTVDGHEVGFVGQLHPDEATRRDLPEPVVVGELLVEPFLTAVPEGGFAPKRARTLARHPAMAIDVALVAADDITFAQLVGIVHQGAGELLDEWWWFDEYRGSQVGPGHRSVAIRLRLHHPDRQLTDADADEVIASIEAAAAPAGVRLRR
ncbi:MAG: phenylalanine--tRNA ligase subunit beta [Nitriliruptoraceae bacterium]